MARDTAISPNLDRLLGEYRAGTKAWGLRAMTALAAAVLIDEDPLTSVVRGTAMVLDQASELRGVLAA